MEPIHGKRLFLKPGTFTGGQSYRIKNQIKKISNDFVTTTVIIIFLFLSIYNFKLIFLQNYFMVSVLKRGMNVLLNIEETIIASKIPLSIFSTVEDPDNNSGSIFVSI